MPNRTSCIDDMIADVPKFIDLFCTGDKMQKNEETCTILTKVQCDIQRLRGAARSSRRPTRAATTRSSSSRRAARRTSTSGRSTARRRSRTTSRRSASSLDEIVENAARAFQAGHLVASAIRARMVLLNPTYQMEKTELAKDAMFKIGGN